MATKFMLVYALYDHQETIIPHFADLLSLDQCSNYILRLLEETRDGFMLRRFEIRVRDNFYFPTDTRFLCGYARDHKKHAGLQYLSPMVQRYIDVELMTLADEDDETEEIVSKPLDLAEEEIQAWKKIAQHAIQGPETKSKDRSKSSKSKSHGHKSKPSFATVAKKSNFKDLVQQARMLEPLLV